MSKVLLTEDDTKLSKALRMRLQHINYDVISVTDAISAMDAAIKYEPNLLLLDINLPGGIGFVVAERLRGHHTTMSVPIIFITASSQPEFAKKPVKSLDLHFCKNRSMLINCWMPLMSV